MKFLAASALLISGALHVFATQPAPVSIAAVQELSPPLTFAAMERAFGPPISQPGPCVSYPCADQKGMSLWFWIEASSDTSAGSDTTKWIIGCVALATTHSGEKPSIIWPTSAINEPPETVIRRVTATYEAMGQ